MFIDREWQKIIVFIFVLAIGFSTILGIYALSISPVLYSDINRQEILESNITEIEHIELRPEYFYKIPIFLKAENEEKWWRKQEELYNALLDKKVVKTENNIDVSVGLMPGKVIVQRVGLLYFVMVVYVLNALVLFRKYHSMHSFLCVIFLFSCAMYISNIVPVIARSITLFPGYFRIFITMMFISINSTIVMVHFFFLFPTPKKILKKYPHLPYFLYLNFLVAVFLFLFKIIGSESLLYIVGFWAIMLISIFSYSFFNSTDMFLEEQTRLSLLAPISIAIAILFMYSKPEAVTAASFTNLALFSLIAPFALPLAIENIHLFSERIEIEKKVFNEREKIRQEIHDVILNDFASISIFSETAARACDNNLPVVKEKLKLIKEFSNDSAQKIRSFLSITDEGQNTCKDFCEYLRAYGYKMLDGLEIKYDLDYSVNEGSRETSFLSIKVCLFKVFREALLNIIKHSEADIVKINILCGMNTAVLEIKDNGKGFEINQKIEEHYGLKNMKNRVKEIGGSFIIETNPGCGTHIKVEIPVIEKK